jgi:hypothetical protein
LSRESREAMQELLVRGEGTYSSIAAQFGVSARGVQHVCARMSPEDKELRRQARLLPEDRKRAQAIMGGNGKAAERRVKVEQEYARIRREIPGWRDATQKDDDTQDAILAMLEGRLQASNLNEGVKEIVKDNAKRFSDPWRDLSLNTTIGLNTDVSFLDMLEDPAALEAFELIDADED